MDTKQSILDAAEQLFAEHGFDGASLRSITSVAGVNLAAVNYHFKSKEALIQAVLARKLGPINRRRLDLLDAIEAEAGAKPAPLEKLVTAMIGPLVRPDAEAASGGKWFGTVMGRVYLERDVTLKRLLAAELQAVIRRFSAAFQRALPGLPAEELYWRLFFSMGVVSHTLGAPGMIEMISGRVCDPSDPDLMLQRLSAYVVSGLRAPLPASLRGKGSRKNAAAAPRAVQPHTRGEGILSGQRG